jgi:L,D-transpeptidase YcbB
MEIKFYRFIFISFLFSLFILFISSCNNAQSKTVVQASELSADLFTSDSLINFFFKVSTESDSIQNEVKQFYLKRNYRLAWFNTSGMTYAVQDFYKQLQNYRNDFNDISFNNVFLDSIIAISLDDEQQLILDKLQTQQLDLILTTTFFKYANKVYGGIEKNPNDLDWFIPKERKGYQVLLDSLIAIKHGSHFNEPLNQYYAKLKLKLKQYRNIEANGGFPLIISNNKILSLGDSDVCLMFLKQYLVLSEDLSLNDGTAIFSSELEAALKHFQIRMGLKVTGKLGIVTLAELNTPIIFRIKQIMLNMERLRWIPVEIEKDYLLVNIPEFKLHVFESGRPIWNADIVVGKSAKQTNIFKGNLSQIVLNPYWGIPRSIIREEILPHIKRNPSYLKKYNMEVLSGNKVVNSSAINWYRYKNDAPFNFRQKPGADNALGKMKFLFPNSYDIYLHDTPSKSLFKATNRAFSHGCIRVENPKRLALYLLRKDTNWGLNKVDKILETEQETRINLSPSTPVYIAYFTAWVDYTGQLNFRSDIYNLDSQLSKVIFK